MSEFYRHKSRTVEHYKTRQERGLKRLRLKKVKKGKLVYSSSTRREPKRNEPD